MNIADALNILTNQELYAAHNLAQPTFRQADDGTLSVSFGSARADKRQFGIAHFETMAQLTAYIAGRQAMQFEAAQDAYDAAQAAQAAEAAQPAQPAEAAQAAEAAQPASPAQGA